MTSPLETSLKELLTSEQPETVDTLRDTLRIWSGHFALLANMELQQRYLLCLQQCKGNSFLQDHRLCVPISKLKPQRTLFLNLKCHGRKVGTVRFAQDYSPTFKPEKCFIDQLNVPHGATPANYRGLLQAFSEGLSSLPRRECFRDVLKPEWKVEAWLLDFLSRDGKEKGEFRLTQPVRYPQQNSKGELCNDGMFLQISNPVSASGKVPKIAAGANAHTDILLRMSLGNGMRLGILEVKATKKGANTATPDKNIAKALKQAFCYAYCYHRVFNCNLLESDGRQSVLNVLGYGGFPKQGPPLTAIAVVPDGSFEQVLNAVNHKDVNLAAAETVKNGRIKLEIWEYATHGEAQFKLTKRHYLNACEGKLVEMNKPSSKPAPKNATSR